MSIYVSNIFVTGFFNPAFFSKEKTGPRDPRAGLGILSILSVLGAAALFEDAMLSATYDGDIATRNNLATYVRTHRDLTRPATLSDGRDYQITKWSIGNCIYAAARPLAANGKSLRIVDCAPQS